MKKILAFILTLAMVMSLMVVPSFAVLKEENALDPIPTNATKITDLDGLKAMKDGAAGDYFYLANEITIEKGTGQIVIPDGVTLDGRNNAIVFEENYEWGLTPPFTFSNATSGTPTTLKNLTFGKADKYIVLSNGDTYHDSYSMTTPLFPNTPTSLMVDWINVDFYFERIETAVDDEATTDVDESATDNVGYCLAIVQNIHGTQNFTDCDLHANIDTTGQFGGFALNSSNTTTFTNCTVNGSIKATSATGGFIKELSSGTTTFNNCVNKAAITTTWGECGAFVGSVRGNLNMSGCENQGAITGDGQFTGGLVGIISEKAAVETVDIQNCTNAGVVLGNRHVGGVIGGFVKATSDNVTLKKLYNRATVSQKSTASNLYYTGGIIGVMGNHIITLEECENHAAVTGNQAYTGGIVGVATPQVYISGSGTSATYYYVSASSAEDYADASKALTFLNCKNYGAVTTVTTGTYADIGGILAVAKGNISLSVTDNKGTTEDTTDDVTTTTYYAPVKVHMIGCLNEGEIGKPISITPVYGDETDTTKITDYTYAAGGKHRTAGGMMAITDQWVSNSVFINVFENCVNRGTIHGGNLAGAGILGYAQDSALVTGCVNNGTVVGVQFIGGMIGYSSQRPSTSSNTNLYANGTTVTAQGIKFANSINTGNITLYATTYKNATGVGGFFGVNGYEKKSHAVMIVFDTLANYGTVTAENTVASAFQASAGGIAGRQYNTTTYSWTFTNCVNYGKVTTKEVGGGIAGWLSNSATFKNCYNYAAIQGHHAVGGIVGDVDKTASFENCLNAALVRYNTGSEGVGGIIGRSTTATLKNCANIGEVKALNTNVAQLLGQAPATSASLENCYALAGTSMAAFVASDNVSGTATTYTDSATALSVLKTWNTTAGAHVSFKANTDTETNTATPIVVDTAAGLKGWQQSTDKSSVRFIATVDDIADLENVGFKYTITMGNETLAEDVTVTASYVLLSVNANTDASLQKELAAVHGGKYFYVITFENIPAELADQIAITVVAQTNGTDTGSEVTIVFDDDATASVKA